MEVMFLGGSNTFLKNGYVAHVAKDLSDRFSSPELDVKNYSVGISACLMGIEQFLFMASNDNPDVIFIEYSINDTSITATNDYLFWSKCYEGLIRMLLLRWPNARVYGLVFASQDKHHRMRIEVMRSKIAEFDAAYDRFCMVDVHSYLQQRHDEASLYRDVMHYAAPVFPDIARCAIEAVVSRVISETLYPLSAPLTDNPFDASSVVRLAGIDGHMTQKFINSQFNFETLILHPDESLTLDVPGEIAAITFVSNATAGILEINDNSGASFVSALHKGVQAGQFSALLMNAPRKWHDWTKPIPDSQTVTLTCRSTPGTPFRPFFSMIEPTTEDVTVQLRSVLVANSRPAT